MNRAHFALIAVLAGICATGAQARGPAPPCHSRSWVGAWAASPTDAPPISYAGETVRVVVTPTISGRRLRVQLTNRFSPEPLEVDSAFVGRQASGAVLRRGSNVPLSFAKRRGVSIPAGGETVSDAVSLRFRAFQHLAISLYLSPDSTGAATEHYNAMQASFVADPAAGDVASSESGAAFDSSGATTIVSRPFVTRLQVRAGDATSGIVALGDSTTDGHQGPDPGEGVDQDARYPDFLARRLIRDAGPRRFSVMNAGISGNSLGYGFVDFFGPPAVLRLRHDVLEQPGVDDVIVMEGRNDLGFSEPRTVIDALAQIVKRLKRHGLNVFLGTLTPGLSPGGPTAAALEAEADRQRINSWIRRQRLTATVVDFDRALRDPEEPARMRSAFSSIDGIHPNSAGYRAMARAVDLDAFTGSGVGGVSAERKSCP